MKYQRQHTSTVLGKYTDRNGKELEAVFVSACGEADVEFRNTINTALDTKYGTDMLVNGCPMDITLKHKKDNERLTDKTFTLDLAGYAPVKLTFGIRTGNRRSKFFKPVVVVHIDQNILYPIKRCWDEVECKLAKHMPEIVNIAKSVYEAA